MSSLLPVLSASFINTRFMTPEQERVQPPIDELPFLDTDLGRGTFAMTMEDFAFFVEERGLDPELVTGCPPDTCYIVVQFIEFGGDHLDQLMGRAAAGCQATQDVVERSRALLTQCRRVVYFINGAALLSEQQAGKRRRTGLAAAAPGEGARPALDGATLEMLVARLEFLDGLLPAGVDVMVLVSRSGARGATAADVSGDGGGAAAAAAGGAAAMELDGGDGDVTPAALIASELARVAKHRGWGRVRLGGRIHANEHLDAAGALNPEAICCTLASMFKRDMVYAAGDPSAFVVAHLLRCFKQPLLRFAEDDTFSIWLTREVFQEYLDELDGLVEAPATMMLQGYDPVARALAKAGLAVEHHAHNYGELAVKVEPPAPAAPRFFCNQAPADGADGVDGAGPAPAGSGDAAAADGRVTEGVTIVVGGVTQAAPEAGALIRFPYADAVLEVLDSYFARGVPSELWMSPTASAWLSQGQDLSLRARLAEVISALERQLVDRLRPPADPAAAAATAAASSPARWLLALEDWALGAQHLTDGSALILPLGGDGDAPALAEAAAQRLLAAGLTEVSEAELVAYSAELSRAGCIVVRGV